MSVGLPKTASVPPSSFSFGTAVPMSSLINVEFCHVASVSDFENTTLGMLFIRSAMTGSNSSATGVGQYEAIPSYVALPKSRVSMSLSWLMLNSLNSASTLGQSSSPFGPS